MKIRLLPRAAAVAIPVAIVTMLIVSFPQITSSPASLALCAAIVAAGVFSSIYGDELAFAAVGDALGKSALAPPYPALAEPELARAIIPISMSVGSSLCIASAALALAGVPLAPVVMTLIGGVAALLMVTVPTIIVNSSVKSYFKDLERELPWFVITIEAAFAAGRQSLMYVLNLVSESSYIFKAFSREARLLLRDIRDVFRSYVTALSMRSRIAVYAEDYSRFLGGLVAVMSESTRRVIDYLQAWIEEAMRSARERWNRYQMQAGSLASSASTFIVLMPMMMSYLGMLGGGWSSRMLYMTIPIVAVSAFVFVVLMKAIRPFELFTMPPAPSVAGLAIFMISLVVLLSILGTKSLVISVLGAWLATIPAMVWADVLYGRMDRFEWELSAVIRVFKDLATQKVSLPFIIQRLEKTVSEGSFSRETKKLIATLRNSLDIFSRFTHAASSPLCRRSFLARFLVHVFEISRQVGNMSPATLEQVARYYIFVKGFGRDVMRYMAMTIMMMYLAPILAFFGPLMFYPQLYAAYQHIASLHTYGATSILLLSNPKKLILQALGASVIMDFIITLAASAAWRGSLFSIKSHAVGLAIAVLMILMCVVYAGIPLSVIIAGR